MVEEQEDLGPMMVGSAVTLETVATSIQATLNGDPILLVTAAGGGGGGNHYYNGSFDASCSVDGDIIGGDGGILQGAGK